MKIEYKILWLDDQIDSFIEDELIEEIEDHLKSEGFKPTIIPVKNSEEFFKLLDDSFDLILTDFHMAGMNGDKVVEKIRKSAILTEILFYTAQADLQDTNKLDRISFLETSKHKPTSHEDVVVERTKDLINLTIKKFQNIIAMRGMIMHETCSLDAQQLNILKNYIKNNDCDFLIDPLFSELDKLIGEKKGKIDARKIKELIKDNFLFSSSYKILALSEILKHEDETDFANDYKSEIINIRNKFAHAILEKDETGKEYFKHGKDGLTFDAELCKKIRQDILKHQENLDNLEKKVLVET